MTISIARRPRRLQGLRDRGLRDPFNPSGSYTATSNILDMGADSSLQNSVMSIANSGIVGKYSGLNVFNDNSTGKVYVDIGTAYPKLQEIVPTNTVITSAPPPATDCPCNNCREETIIETWYASKNQTSPSDIPVNMSSEVVVCEPINSPNGNQPQILCAADLAALNAQGINGLRDTWQVSKANKKCIDKCKGSPNIEKCYSGCMGINQQPLYTTALTPSSFTSINRPSMSGIGAVSKGNYQMGLVFTGRTADSAWGKCAAACNGKGLSQNELQKCYDACQTGRAVVNTGYTVAPNGQLVRSLSGLSNETTTDDSEIVYDTPITYPIAPTMDCERGNSNTLLLILTGIAGLAIGWLATTAWKKR